MFAPAVTHSKTPAKAEQGLTRKPSPQTATTTSGQIVKTNEQSPEPPTASSRSWSFTSLPISPPGPPTPTAPTPISRLLGSQGERFGSGNVRIHTNNAAASSAHGMNAQAYTYGQDIVFGEGEFNPASQAGRALLQHELAHTLQQTSPGRYHLAFQKKPTAPAKFFRELSDAVDAARRATTPDPDLPYLEDLLALSEAVDAQNVPEVKRLTPRVIGHQPTLNAPTNRSVPFVNELLTRTLLMGLEAEANKLRPFFREIQTKTAIDRSHRIDPGDRKYDADIKLWRGLAARSIAEEKFGTAAEASSSITRLLTTFSLIVKETGTLDPKAIHQYRDMSVTLGDLSQADYFNALQAELAPLALEIFNGVEVMMEAAIADLEADKGTAALNAVKAKLLKEVLPTLKVNVGGGYFPNTPLQSTRSDLKSTKKKHLDYFDTSKAGKERSVSITFFDPKQTTAEELSMPVAYIFNTRMTQIAFLENFYTKGNRAAMGSSPLKLESVDDWRQFLHAKVLEARKTPGKGQSDDAILLSLISYLNSYLAAFTVHTPFNIDDVVKEDKDNYLKRKFPRALTGQLLEDCGVFALQIIYMLSLVKSDLGLRFRLVFLPQHVNLVITGDKLSTTLIAENNKIIPLEGAAIARERKTWAAMDPTKPTDDNQFIGELAGRIHSPGVDMPFRIQDVPQAVPPPAKSSKKAAAPAKDPLSKEELQKAYGKGIQHDVVVDAPKAGPPQFSHEYTNLQEKWRKTYNEVVIPAWNGRAAKAWRDHGQKLIAELKKAHDGKPNRYKEESAAYLAALDKAMKPAIDAAANDAESRAKISKTIGEHKELVDPSATAGFGSRISLGVTWESQLEEHKKAVANLSNIKDANKPNQITPPFASEKGLLPLSF